MGISITRWITRWRDKQEQMKLGLRNSRVHRLLGDRLFNQHVWGYDRQSVAGGLALGLFIAFTPTIPFHMLLCALGAILLRVNLAVAEVAIWVTNPITAVPVYLAANRFGRFLCAHTEAANFISTLFNSEGRTERIVEEGLYLWTGSLVFAVVSAVLGYMAVFLTWPLFRRRT